VGDCKGVRVVTVDDVITMINIALGNMDISACTAGDADGDGTITIEELIRAVDNLLSDCPA
jgi:Ca2+-binding EF-hand superfamily protein